MASIKISELEEVTKLSTSDVLPIINENKTKKVSLEKLNEILGGNGGEVDFGIEILDIPGGLKSDSSGGNPNSYHTDAATCELLSNYINSCKDKQLQSIIVKYGPELQFAGVFSPLFGASTVNTSITLYKLNTSMKDARYADIATQTGTVAYFCDEITLYIKGTWTNGVYSCTGYCVHNTIRNMITQSYVDEKTLLKTNTTAFTPTGDYNPATKKYVDDAIANIDIPEGDGGNSGLPQPMYFVTSNNIRVGSDNTDSNICAKFSEILTNARAFWNGNGVHQIVLIDNYDYTNVIFKSKPGSFGTYYGTCYYPKVFDTLEKTYELKLTYSSSNDICTVTKFRINEITIKRTATDPTENNQVATKNYVDNAVKNAITSVLEAEY